MKKKLFLLFALMLLILKINIYSQTAEDKFLSRKEKILLNYSYQATQGNRVIKLQVLDKIIEGMDSNEFSADDKQVVDLVIYLTQEGTIRKSYENNVLVNNYPDVRLKACKVITKIGGQEARTALVEVIKNETSSMVLAEACNSLGVIGDDGKGEALRAIIYLYRTTYNPQQNLVFAVINAIRTLATNDAGSYGDAILILSEIQLGQYNQKIRDTAYEAIQSLTDR